MSAPSLSIVIPCRDRAALLRRALDSIAAQREAPQSPEVIVVDDGSRDDTAAVANAHPACSRCVRLPRPVGPGAARNAGAARARGQFVQFMDSDDVLMPWALTHVYDVLASQPEPAMVLLREQAVAGDLPLREHAPTDRRTFPDYAAAAGAAVVFGGGVCVVRRQEFETAGGFATGLMICEDQDLGFRLSEAGPCVWLEAPVCLGRGIGHPRLMDDVQGWLAGMRYLLAREQAGQYPGGDGARAGRARLLSRSFRTLAVGLAREGRMRAAWQAYCAGLPLHRVAGAWRFVLLFAPWWLLRAGASFARSKV